MCIYRWIIFGTILSDRSIAVRPFFFRFKFFSSFKIFFFYTKFHSDNIRKWLVKLNEPHERTVELTNEFRRKGNEYFEEMTGDNDLATDYYTKAIFSAPKDSVELALAHANRAACAVTSDRFYEVRILSVIHYTELKDNLHHRYGDGSRMLVAWH